jgi:hypothetical protein
MKPHPKRGPHAPGEIRGHCHIQRNGENAMAGKGFPKRLAGLVPFVGNGYTGSAEGKKVKITKYVKPKAQKGKHAK